MDCQERDIKNTPNIFINLHKAFNQLVQEENLSAYKTHKLIENYLFAERELLRAEVIDLIEGEKPSELVRKKLGDKILNKIVGCVETFINGVTGN